jgi:putative addiction module antidote
VGGFLCLNERYNFCNIVAGEIMTSKLKITSIGNSTGVILPKEILEKLRVSKGDTLFAIETAKGIELTAYNPEVAEQMKLAEQVMREDRDALRKLAE